jgi:hypothetical protein
VTIGWGVLLRALLLATCIGLVWTGAGFLTYGMYVALVPSLGAGGAALLSGFISFIVGFTLLTLLVISGPQVQAQHASLETPVVQGGAIVKALSELAEEHPLMAVFCAAVLGATNNGHGVRRR